MSSTTPELILSELKQFLREGGDVNTLNIPTLWRNAMFVCRHTMNWVEIEDRHKNAYKIIELMLLAGATPNDEFMETWDHASSRAEIWRHLFFKNPAVNATVMLHRHAKTSAKDAALLAAVLKARRATENYSIIPAKTPETRIDVFTPLLDYDPKTMTKIEVREDALEDETGLVWVVSNREFCY